MPFRERGGLSTQVESLRTRVRETAAGDEGFFVPGVFLGALGRLSLRKMPYRRTIGGSLALGALLGLGANYSSWGTRATANLEAATTTVEVKLIDFTQVPALKIADSYFDVRFDARGIKYEIEAKRFGIDVVPDYEGNLEIHGIGAVHYIVPPEAIQQKPNGGKIDFVIDPTKTKTISYWDGAGPEARRYTMDDGRPNYGDRSGFTRSWNQLNASLGSIAGVDGLANTMEDLDKAVEHDATLKGLEIFTTRCNDRLKQPLKDATRLALVTSLATVGREGDIGTVTYAPGVFSWEREVGPDVEVDPQGDVKKVKYRISDFPVDEVTCTGRSS